MCAIGGLQRLGSPPQLEQLQDMLAAIAHRGPDGNGVKCHKNVGFVHARLAIQDMSQASSQPFESDDFILLFNGEIYNFVELRDELKRDLHFTFESDGDFEVLVAGFRNYGLKFIEKINGDFAIAYYEKKHKRLYLIRDRLGIKPLYYQKNGNQFAFCSEIRGLQKIFGRGEIQMQSVQSYLAFRYVRGEDTIYSEVKRVEAGSYLVVDENLNHKIIKYWTPFTKNCETALSQITENFHRSVQIRTRAKVPLGALLSGGMDSSLIVKAAHLNAKGRIQNAYTFNSDSNFGGESLDFKRAQRFAETLGISLESVSDAPEVFLKKAIVAIEEPVADAVISPLYALINRARQDVKVLLSGEGADEIFYGYGHHSFFSSLERVKGASTLLGCFVQSSFGQRIFNQLNFFYPTRLGTLELSRIRYCLENTDEVVDCYHKICEIFDEPMRRDLTGAGEDLRQQTYQILKECEHLSLPKKIIFLEMKTWLTNYNLMKLDKIAGSFGMEARVPFLDHELVELAFSLPDEWLWSLFQRKPAVVNMCDALDAPVFRKIPFVQNSCDFTSKWSLVAEGQSPPREIDYQVGFAIAKRSGDGLLAQKMSQSLFIYKNWRESV